MKSPATSLHGSPKTPRRVSGSRSVGFTWVDALAEGSIAGMVGGEVFLLVGALITGAEDLGFSPTVGHAVLLVLRSIALYGLLGAGCGLLIGACLMGLASVSGRELRVFALTCAAALTCTTLVYLTVWWQLEVAHALPFDASQRLYAGLWHFGAAAISGCLSYLIARRVRIPTGIVRYALVISAAIALLLGVTTYAFRLRPAEYQQHWKPSQVAIVGLDGMTLRVLAPLIRAGELPTFRALVKEGSWGSLLTYGITASPVVWTTVATGRKPEDHGITDFVRSRPGRYQKTPVRSTDRRAPALWNLVTNAGLSSAVVNWLVTNPPQKGADYTITGLSKPSNMRSYPPQLADELRLLVSDLEAPDHLATSDRVFTVAGELVQQQHLAFVALYDRASDNVQHMYWKYYEPDLFDPDIWQFSRADVETHGKVIPDVYRYLDQRLGVLMSLLDEDGLLIVLSDHGQHAGTRRRCQFSADRVLAALGYAELNDEGNIDHARSGAYSFTDSTWDNKTRININRRGREPRGFVGNSDAAEILERLANDLRSARFEHGGRLFQRVEVGEVREEADLVAYHSRHTRATESLDHGLSMAGNDYEYSEFAELLTSVSGDHDHQGIIFVRGKGVRRGPLGQRVLTTAFQRVLWRLTGREEALDAWLPLLGSVGLIERATTLDVAPTVLHALDLPLSLQFPGRPLVELFMGQRPIEWVDSLDQEALPPVNTEADSQEAEELEQLRALDYIN